MERRRFGLADRLIVIAGIARAMGRSRFLLPEISLEELAGAFRRPSGGWTYSNVVELTFELSIYLRVPVAAACVQTA